MRHHPWEGFGFEQALVGLSKSPRPEMTNNRRRIPETWDLPASDLILPFEIP
jgi:hypothetical protein